MGRKSVRDARNIVLGTLKGMKACLPRNFQRFKMTFCDTEFMSTYLFVFKFENFLFSNWKIELYENAADKHRGKGKNNKMFS